MAHWVNAGAHPNGDRLASRERLGSKGQARSLVVSMGEPIVQGPWAAYAMVGIERRIRSPGRGLGEGALWPAP